MAEFPELYILRHGETAWNAEHRMQGALNSPLTDKGKGHAALQADILAGIDLSDFDAWCSPQGRAFETAAIAVARQVPFIHTDIRLREIGVGQWQGKVRSELKTDIPIEEGPDGPIALYAHAPEGEGFDALETRCTDFLISLTRPAVLITHGITSRMLRSIVLGSGRESVGQLPGGQGNVFHLKNGMQNQLG